jgi:serine/threonine-protein kinase
VALALGTRLGSYDIIALLGTGGMGEVYRARDTTLHRDVALKILPDTFAADPDRVARFRREARVLAALNHPNIATIYGVEDSGRVHALVLELVEGPTLADRIVTGPIPLDEALPIAKQVAEALEVAHELGIIHRDLKPANIKVRDDGTVKVLDFGLAKALEPASAISPSLTNAPAITTSTQLTEVGTLLGTAAYMSPEQAKGRPADKRSDIWAFGCVLFEMLTGRRAFDGENVGDTLAAVLRGEPDWKTLPSETPAAVRTFLRCCLEKDRHRRIADISTARFALRELSTAAAPSQAPSTAAPAPSWRRVAFGVLLFATGAGLAAGAIWIGRRTPPPAPVVRFSITLDGRITVPFSRFAISRDGTKIVYATDRLYIRRLAESTARPISGTDLANGVIGEPTFSPDGSAIVFWSGRDPNMGELKTVAVDGGPVIPVASASVPFGMSWDTDGIVYAQVVPTAYSHLPTGILRVSPNGGQPQPLVAVKGFEGVSDPQMLPGQNALLFTYASRIPLNGPDLEYWDKARIVVQSLSTRQRTVVVDGGSAGRYVSSGHLLYAVGETVRAVPFDVKEQRVTGSSVQVLEHVRRPGPPNLVSGAALFSVSDTGSLLYVAPESIKLSPNFTTVLALMNSKGELHALNLPPAEYNSPRVSPTGKRIAYYTDNGKEASVWTYDLSGATGPTRLTFGWRDRYPIWTPDGRWITFASNREGGGIFRQRVDGTAKPERLTSVTGTSADIHVPLSWSRQPTGDVLLFADSATARESLLKVLTMADRKIAPWGGIKAPPSTALLASFSPNGQWVAYSLDEGSGSQVYVRPFDGNGGPSQIDVDALDPRWSPDGHDLFYLSSGSAVSRVLLRRKIATTPVAPLPLPTPVELRRIPGDLLGVTWNYDVLPDGDVIRRASASDGPAPAPVIPPIQVVLNWFTELQQHVPTR